MNFSSISVDYAKIECHGGKRSLGLDSNQRSLSYQDFNHNFWNAYKNYLESGYRHETMKAKFSYARQYYKVLADQNASHLLRLQPTKRIHVMKAISTLSKFLGCYNIWQDIRNRHNLKWTNINEQNSFNSLNLNLNLNTMLEWLKSTLQKIPTQYGNILIYSTRVLKDYLQRQLGQEGNWNRNYNYNRDVDIWCY
jgi:hypothetical protein